jgi:hypothetical protein
MRSVTPSAVWIFEDDDDREFRFGACNARWGNSALIYYFRESSRGAKNCAERGGFSLGCGRQPALWIPLVKPR